MVPPAYADLASSSKQAVKLRLQLTEYCLLKCARRAQLPALVPLLLKQVRFRVSWHTFKLRTYVLQPAGYSNHSLQVLGHTMSAAVLAHTSFLCLYGAYRLCKSALVS